MSEYKSIFSDKTLGKLRADSAESLKDMLKGKSFMQASMDSMKLLPQIMEAEKPYRDQLVELAKEVLLKAYPIVEQTGIEIEAELVQPGALNMQQSNEPDEEEVNQFIEKSGIDRRRIINAITQGASIRGTKAFYIFKDLLDVMDESLVEQYNEIIGNAYGIYDDDNAIAMMLAMMSQNSASQGGESEVDWDEEEGTLVIKAKAIIFPILIHELVKGLYEILSLQGFGTDAEQNKSIVGKADQLAAEPNDMRFGKFIYDAANKLYIESGIEDDRVRDFFFTELYKIDDETEFIEFVENLVTSKLTSAQKKWAMDAMRDIERDLKADDAGIPNDEGDEDVFTEIKTQPVNKLIKPTKKKIVTDEPYINIDTSFIEDYILDYGEISYDTIQFFNFINVKANENTIRDAEYIDHILNGDYKLYFNSNPQEIDNVLSLNDPLNIKDYARDKAEMLTDNSEDIDFLAEEIMLAIETIQDNIPKYIAAKKILKDKFTIISNDEFSVILTSDSDGHSLLYTMIEKQDGYFNKNGEIVIYTT